MESGRKVYAVLNPGAQASGLAGDLLLSFWNTSALGYGLVDREEARESK